jgi:FixJ family two-component response regulator
MEAPVSTLVRSSCADSVLPGKVLADQERVRVLDDDEQVLKCLSSILRSASLKVEGFRDPHAFFAAEAPACAVVDSELGGADALEVVASCRDRWPHTPVILISGQATVAIAVRAMRQGAVGVLEKPVRASELREEITAAIELGRQRAEALRQRDEAQHRIAELSAWERTILEYLVQGMPNKSIAARMNLAMRTIEKYRRSMFNKLGVDSAAEAARVWTLARLDGEMRSTMS